MSIETMALNAVLPGAGTALGFGQFIRRHLPGMLMMLVVVVLAGALYWAPWAEARGRHSRDLEVAGLKNKYADLQAADANAQAAAVAHALEIERAQDKVKEAQANETQDLLARARADAAAYAVRLRRQAAGTAQGNGQQSAPGQGGGSAAGAPGDGPLSFLDAGDLQICTENTVKAVSWQAFWTKLKAIAR